MSTALFAMPVLADVSEGVALLEDGDVAAAASSFAQAYEDGDAEGAFYLARLFELGLGTEPDPQRAANLYAAAAELGSQRGQLRLGLMYHEGRVLLRDYVEGTRLICEAADAGLAEAQLNCGLSYQAGRGVDAAPARAREYWELSAAQGNIAALNVLGQSALSDGDVDIAQTRFETAAEAGNPVAMLSLAEILDAQEAPDLIGAYAWSSLAVVRGLNEAAAFRDGLEARMTSADVLAGQAQARAWTESKLADIADEDQ
ncbi:tetratricopeptide repeat protein [Octadecabacter dasysiphoniae]|uniref:tetratricopeptide repeat protein n=1 Tax=Octadecabacter dasysiphoniae TaxID=2909341 RepID=UPI001F4642FD|nr:tetratricopeptide repeat protein [Octadecabacter dasysiphoniae]